MLRYFWDRLRQKRTILLMLAPYMLLFFVFTVLPVCRSILYSFTGFNILEPPRFAGFDNYIRLFFHDDVVLVAFKNTFIFAAITGPASYLLCFLLAWLINDLGRRARMLFTILFYAPSMSGAVATVWAIIFSPDRYGYANSFLLSLGILTEPVKWLKDPKYILMTIIVVQLWMSLGTSFLAFIAGLQGIDRGLYEAGAVEGIRNRWQEVWFITLPSMRPQLMFGAVMQITAAFSVSDIANALAGFPSVDYAAQTLVTHLLDYGMIRYEFGYASAIATVLFIIMVATNAIVQKLLSHVGQ